MTSNLHHGRHRFAACGLIVLLWISGGILSNAVRGESPPEAAEPTGQFLVLSDFHFDPFYDPALFSRLQQAPVEQWRAILAESRPAGCNPVGRDTNHALLASTFDDAKTRLPRPDFIICAGDFLAHDCDTEFDRLAPGVRAARPEVFQQFTLNTLKFVIAELKRRFPGVPLYPALGNEDSFCGDYDLTPEGDFLRDFSQAWAPTLFVSAPEREAVEQSMVKLGCYSLSPPGHRKLRLISFNSVFFSSDYHDDCGDQALKPGGKLLAWLEAELVAARQAGQKVWLISHIPPGIDSYDTARAARNDRPAVEFWQASDLAAYLQLVARFRSTIALALAGHTHMDDYRVARVANEPVLFTKLAPGISPIFGNNPGYQAYQCDAASAAITNYQTWALPLATAQPRQGTSGGALVWNQVYDFNKAYGPTQFTAAGMNRWWKSLVPGSAEAMRYRQYYAVGSPKTFPLTDWPIHRAAIGCATVEEFQAGLAGESSR